MQNYSIVAAVIGQSRCERTGVSRARLAPLPSAEGMIVLIAEE